MRASDVEYAKGWGYEVTLPGEPEPIEVSEAEVEAEFARRLAERRVSVRFAQAARLGIAEELARGKCGVGGGRAGRPRRGTLP